MKVIYNKHLPPGKFAAINIFGLIFARKEYQSLSKYDLNHEKIHTIQMLELLGVFYYMIYFGEWIIRLFQYKNPVIAYHNISFEREAYENENNLDYIRRRKMYSFVNYYKFKRL